MRGSGEVAAVDGHVGAELVGLCREEADICLV